MRLSKILDLRTNLSTIIDSENLHIDKLLKYKLLCVMSQFEAYFNNFQVVRNELIKQYGVKKDSGYEIDIEDKESVEKFSEEMKKILDSEVELSLQKLKYTDIIDKKVPAEVMVGLIDIIEED